MSQTKAKLVEGVTSGSTSSSFVVYNGTTKSSGQFDGGTTAPSNTTRLNYDGYLYATKFYGDGSSLSGVSASYLQGYQVSTSATASSIVLRDGSGDDYRRYGFGSYFNSSDDVSSGSLTYLMGKFGDNYYRSATAAKVATFISGQTMNISGSSTSCSGNSATATTASSCSGNSATATTASSCSGNAATATTASSCTGNSATATTASSCSGNSATATTATNQSGGTCSLGGTLTMNNNQISGTGPITPYASGVNSGSTRSSYPYSFGFQESGSWTHPYPDLVFQYHTGITIAANPSYEGIRFKADYSNDTLIFQINGTSNYTYKYTWMYTNTTGFYSDTNSWQMRPNTSSTYTSGTIEGSRNSYGGFYDVYSGVNIGMYDSAGNGGVYREANGRWILYHLIANNCMGVNTSTTSGSYGMYVSGGVYSTGNVVAYSDARKKTEIKTVTNALDKVNQLRGVTYKRIDIEDNANSDKVEMGVIAQEVEPIVPEVVTYAEDVDEYGVSYGNFAGLFIEAIKEQTIIINNLKKEIEELKSKLGE
jgi:hypothetical protein